MGLIKSCCILHLVSKPPVTSIYIHVCYTISVTVNRLGIFVNDRTAGPTLCVTILFVLSIVYSKWLLVKICIKV